MNCHIVIPCFHESVRLPGFLADLVHQLASQDFAGRITIVDDGSGEIEVRKTQENVEKALASFPGAPVDWLLLPQNQGKGGAVYAGWRKAVQEKADILAFADADGSTSGSEVCRIIAELVKRYDSVDGVFGSRVKMLGQEIQRDFRRHLIGRCFATMVSFATGISAYDTQCGAKALKASSFQGVLPQLREMGFAFDVELTLALLKRGDTLIELPISWKEIPGSKVRIVRDVTRMASAILRMRKHLGTLKRPKRIDTVI